MSLVRITQTLKLKGIKTMREKGLQNKYNCNTPRSEKGFKFNRILDENPSRSFVHLWLKSLCVLLFICLFALYAFENLL